MQLFTDPSLRQVPRSYLARRIAQRIEECFSDAQFSMRSIVDDLGYSRSQIIRIFKCGFGKTPKEYLLSLRLSNAKRMIEERNHQDIMYIAYEVGYENYEHFCREFKKKYGHSPSQKQPERGHK